jgi:hypothetical protein
MTIHKNYDIEANTTKGEEDVGNDPPPIKQMTKTNYSEHIFASQG